MGHIDKLKYYNTSHLKLIVNVLNILQTSSDHTYGVIMDSFHISRFYGKTHYIDFDEKSRKCRVRKKKKCWAPSEEKLVKK